MILRPAPWQSGVGIVAPQEVAELFAAPPRFRVLARSHPSRFGEETCMNTRSRDLIRELARTPGRLETLMSEARSEHLATKKTPEEFSLREHVHHLRDLEIEGWKIRLERLLHEDRPLLPGIDGERLARDRRYNERAHDDALAEFSSMRAACVLRLDGLAEAQWERPGTLAETGPI